MFKVIVGANLFSGVLKNYELSGEDLILRFALRGSESIELILPKIPPQIYETCSKLGLIKMKDATLDLNNGKIKMGEVVKSPGNTVQLAAKKGADARPPRMQIGASLVG
jgi:hypothetical protein